MRWRWRRLMDWWSAAKHARTYRDALESIERQDHHMEHPEAGVWALAIARNALRHHEVFSDLPTPAFRAAIDTWE